MPCSATTFLPGIHDNNRTITNWSGEVSVNAADYWEPAPSSATVGNGLSKLVLAVETASAANQEIHAIGSGWAFEDLAMTTGALISLRRLDGLLDYVVGAGAALTDGWRARQADPQSASVLVHVEAGIRIAKLSEDLEARGLALPTIGGANGQALAGAISTSTHGGDWQHPPFPDLVRAIHLVTDGGREVWIERASAPITQDDRLAPVLPCAQTELIRDDSLFEAVLVACGRFGIIYSVVLEVRRSFRVVEVVTTPVRADVLQALRDGVGAGTLLGPLFTLLSATPPPSGITDATGTPYFVQVLFNSQRPDDVWAHRRWETTNAADLPAPPAANAVEATGSDHDRAVGIVEGVNAALFAAAGLAGIGGVYILGVQVAFNIKVASRAFTLGSVVAAALEALWSVPAAGYAIPELNRSVIDGALRPAITAGRRGPHYIITSGTRADSDNISYRAASIELVFDATSVAYLDFLDEVLAVAPSFQQAGYVSLRFSKASRALLSMHRVAGAEAVSIEISSIQGLPGNNAWMQFVERVAVRRGGRPHWGQHNGLSAGDVEMLYGVQLQAWREALVSLTGSSSRFSNAFTRARGLEPRAIVREVTATRQKDGAITHLCHPGEPWSPVSLAQAIRDIESGAARYFVRGDGRIAEVEVFRGQYLRTTPDDTTADNLDRLPPC